MAELTKVSDFNIYNIYNECLEGNDRLITAVYDYCKKAINDFQQYFAPNTFTFGKIYIHNSESGENLWVDTLYLKDDSLYLIKDDDKDPFMEIEDIDVQDLIRMVNTIEEAEKDYLEQIKG